MDFINILTNDKILGFLKSLMGLLCLLGAECLFFIWLGVGKNSESYLLWGAASLIILTIFVWYKLQQLPKTPKGKIGFLVCLNCMGDGVESKVREDFVLPLEKNLKNSRVGELFHFLNLPQSVAADVHTQSDAEEIRSKCNAMFMLYGGVKKRTLDGKDHHMFVLDGIIACRAMDVATQSVFVREFTELLPRRVNIPVDNDVLSFQFASEWADSVAKYIIGLALATSGALNDAESLFCTVLQGLRDEETFPVYQKLAGVIPLRVAEINRVRALGAYDEWMKSRDMCLVEEMGTALKAVPMEYIPRLDLFMLLAIYFFIGERKVEDAIKILQMRKAQKIDLWCYNMAFLEAYRGDLKKAIRLYRDSISTVLTESHLGEIENFMHWILEEEPDKVQFYYCLGFFNWKIKGDGKSAQRDFQMFIEKASAMSLYPKEVELAQQWITECEIS